MCLGNICRSPTAEGIFRRLVVEAGLDHAIEADSAGTGAWHVGEPPDARARDTAHARGVRLESRARRLEAADLEAFDYVLAMDGENLREIHALARRAGARGRIGRLLAFHPRAAQGRGEPGDVPDPYYGGPSGFDDVFDLCEEACRGLLEEIRTRHRLPPPFKRGPRPSDRGRRR